MLIRKPFYFIRHGETDWNVKNIAQGQIDIELNSNGIAQAYKAQEFFKSHKIDLICHSPLIRAKKTALIINEILNVPMLEIEDLKECNFGSYEGKKITDWMDNWKKGISVDTIENLNEFSQRILSSFNKALEFDQNILIVGHGISYWALKKMLEPNENFFAKNCVPLFHQPSRSDNSSWNIEYLQ